MKKDLIKLIMNAIAKSPASPAVGACCYPSMTPGYTACKQMDSAACSNIKNSSFHAGVVCSANPCRNSGPVPA